jgi:NAD(P)-dependent dehydrogenase (short-subunit alcohol dehydrogenase family)
MLDQLVAEIRSSGGCASSAPADVSNEAQVVEMVQDVVDAFGGLDVVGSSLGGWRLPLVGG